MEVMASTRTKNREDLIHRIAYIGPSLSLEGSILIWISTVMRSCFLKRLVLIRVRVRLQALNLESGVVYYGKKRIWASQNPAGICCFSLLVVEISFRYCQSGNEC